MAGKKVLPKFQIITAGAMTGTAAITSLVTNIELLDNIAIQMVWTGSPTGTFDLQGSVSYSQDQFGNVLSAGTWTSITLNPQPAAAGSASNWLIDANQLSSPWIRIVYTNASGTGTLNAWIAGKAV